MPMTAHHTALRSIGALLRTAACSSPPPAAAPTQPEPAQPAKQAQSAPSSDETANLTVSDDIRQRCGISDEATYFAYNSSSVSKQVDSLLGQVVKCFTTGPLAGETLSLVGHADPRGDEEYNYVLGGRRASQVEQRLQSLGLPQDKVSTTSRGEAHASGTDESGWAQDRRVDLEIGGTG